jgi:hypothetical protein
VIRPTVTDGVARAKRTLAAADVALELRRRARAALDGGLQKQVKLALFGGAQALLGKMGHGGGPIRGVAKKLDTLEKDVAAALGRMGSRGTAAAEELVARYTGGGLRAQLISRALHAASKYQVRLNGASTSIDMIQLAWRCSRLELVRDENELQYILEQVPHLLC